jgi:hypothetical protein
MKKMAEDICKLLDTEDQLPGWVQDLVATSHNDLQHVHDYLMGDAEMNSYEKSPQQMMPTSESRKRNMKTLSEGHARITDKEIAAWKRGDWGFVSEGASGTREMSHDDAITFIASQPADETVPQDIMDPETGEIYIEAGKTYGDSYHHPDFKASPKPSAFRDYDEDDEEHAEDEEQDPHDQFNDALKEFSKNFFDMGMNLEELGASPEDAAHDLGANFFHDYPQWKKWANALGMSKAEVQSAAAEAAYEALTSGH